MRRLELAPRARRRAADGAHRAREHMKQPQAPGGLPSTEIARPGGTPGVRCEPGARIFDAVDDRDDPIDRHPALLCGPLECVGVVRLPQEIDERLETQVARAEVLQRLLPAHPAPNEVAVDCVALEQLSRDGEEEAGFGARPRRQPDVRHRRGVGEARIDGRQLGPRLLAFDDPLRVRVEVVAGLEVAGQQQDEPCVGEVGRRAIVAHPHRIAGASAGGADVGVAVVTVDAPRAQRALHETVLARAADVVHDLVVPVLLNGGPHPERDVAERVFPGHLRPLATSAGAAALQRVEDPFGVIHLVERRRALRAVAASGTGVRRIALELAYLSRLLVDVCEQAAGRFAVETRRGNEAGIGARLSSAMPGRRTPPSRPTDPEEESW